MSQADELLDSLTEDQVATYGVDTMDEPHIVINADRTITVPDDLKHIAVQGEHNIETVTFDCPRYWDGHDLSAMSVRVNYQRPDGHREPYPVKNLCVDETDTGLIHFDWTLSRNVTIVKGNISFMVCAKIADADGITEREWHSRLNQDLTIDEGLECSGDEIVEQNPDIIEFVLARLDVLESTGGVSDDNSESSSNSGERADVTVDAEMSDESTNPVQNKVAKAYIDALAALLPDYGYLKGLKYAAWGDSIVDMQGTLTAPETFGDTGYTTDLQGRDISGITVEGYVSAIERRYGLAAANYGKGGHTIVGDYSSIVGMDYSDVALVTIAYGVNDARTGVPLGTVNSVDPTTFAGALNLILKKIYNDNPECRVLVLTPIQRLYVSDFGIATPNANGNYLIDFCRMCEKVAAKRSTKCINMYEQCGINQTNLYYYTVEGVHPVNQGFARMTNAIIPVLDGMFALPYDPIGSMTNSGGEEPDEPENGDGAEETPEEDPVGEAVDLTGRFVYDGIIYDCYIAEPNRIGSDSYNASSFIVCTEPIELTPGKVYTVVSYLSSTGVYFGLVNGSADRRILDEETGNYTANRVNDVVLKNAGPQVGDVAQSVTEVEIDGATYRKLTATIAPTTTRYLWLGGLRSMQDKITLTVV